MTAASKIWKKLFGTNVLRFCNIVYASLDKMVRHFQSDQNCIIILNNIICYFLESLMEIYVKLILSYAIVVVVLCIKLSFFIK